MGLRGARPARRQEIRCSWERLAEVLIKANDLHEGHWRVALAFGEVGGFNAELPGKVFVPSAWIPVMGAVLVREDVASPLTVDASVVNPRQGAEPVTAWPLPSKVQ